ncbi:MAG: mechanosensitive ion channel [Planctomycetes bacterium]|nr:mechanosensitive ion channel [Planctomycetota bacterium]MCB9905958.1 mechanosensitive ion channel [Planctomycetota bacterium]
MTKVVEQLQQFAEDHWMNVVGGIAILFFGWIAAKMLRGAIGKLMRRAKVDETLVSFMTNLVYMASMAFVCIMALGEFGVDTTSFAAVIAAAGLAIGFALQGSLGNFAAGAMIIMLRPFKVGDYIEAGGTAGVVEAITVFATTLKTPDNKVVIIPNGSVTGGNIVNYSTKPQRRVDMVMGISYSDDIPKAKALFEKILADHPKVLADPAPKVAVQALADSSVNIVVRPWCNSADYWDVYFDITEQVKLECDKAGITIPFPQRDVHLHQVA